MGKERTIIDTNVIISAFRWGKTPKVVLDKIVYGHYELIISLQQLEELARVVEYPKLGFTRSQQRRLMVLLMKTATLVNERPSALHLVDDKIDDHLLSLGVMCDVTYLITGDNELLSFGNIGILQIVSPQQFLNITNKNT